MEFRILGPLAVVDNGAELPLGGPRQRSVLAALLLRANEIVSSDRLIDLLWGERPPANAPTTLQGYVWHLRRALEPGHERGTPYARLAGERPGYRLVVGPDELDRWRFERLLAAGKQSLADGRAEDAARLLDEALALWRGPALADLAYEQLAAGEAASLDELRLSAREELIDARLELGGHAELVGELEILVRDHPQRERLTGQLMLALYRSGRQADALETYRDARRTLVDELGVDPSPALQELERRILNQDVALEATAGTGSIRRPLPAPSSPLVGRADELRQVAALLQEEGVRLVTLTGPGGTGKTRLALELAARLEDRFADGAVFVPLAAIGDADLVPSALAQSLDVAETPGVPLLESLADALRRRDLLLVADNLEHVPAAAATVATLLGAAPRLRVLATSRSPLRVSAEHEVPVPPLRRADAASLFVERARAVRPDLELADEDADVVAEICQRLDGLPLAIELAAARIRALPPATLLARLDRRLPLLAGGARDLPERQQTLRDAIDWSYRLLEPAERLLFTRLAVFAGGATIEAAESVCNPDGNLGVELLEGLSTLVAGSMLLAPPLANEPRFRMLATIREFAADELEAGGERETLRRRHAEYFTAFAERANRSFYGAGEPESLDRLDAEANNFRSALRWAAAGDAELEVRLAGALARYWYLRGHLDEGRRSLEGALERGSSVAPRLRAEALRGSGTIAFRQGDYAGARSCAQAALELYREAGDRQGVARCLDNLGYAAVCMGDYDDAVGLHEQSAAISRELGNHQGVAAATINLANLALNQGDPARASALADEALQLSRTVDYEEGVLVSLLDIGLAQLGLGDDDRAAAMLSEALPLAARLGATAEIVHCLEGLAAVASARSQWRDAALLAGAAEGLCKRTGVLLEPFERSLHDRTTAAAALALDVDFDAAFAAGLALSPEDAVRAGLERAAAPR